MSKGEILSTRIGEMLDLIDCYAIAHGAEPAKKKKTMTYDEAISLR